MTFHNRDLHLAIAASKRGDTHRALEFFRAALAEDPESAVAHAHLAHCLFKAKKHFAAAREADLAISNDPTLPIAHIVRAMSDAMLDDEKGAEASLDEALRLDPENEMALKLRCAFALTQRDIPQMERATQVLLSVVPDDAEAHYLASRLATLKHDADSAEEHARIALRLDPNEAAHHLAIGWAFWVKKDFENAKAAGLSALSLDPNMSSVHELLAAVEMHSARLTGWFNRFGYVLDNMNLKKAALWGVPLMFLYTVSTDVLDYLGMEGLSDGLLRGVQGLVLLIFISTQLFARKAKANQKAAVLKMDY